MIDLRATPPSPTGSCRLPRSSWPRPAGIETMALTDHDAVDGLPEAIEAAEKHGIEIVPAAEISCIHESIDDLHMLGYWIDIEKMKPMCERAQQERVTRAQEIVERLNSLGVEVDYEEAKRQAGDAASVGRPHIAKAAGTKPEEMGAFFEEYLIPGAKAFVVAALAHRRRSD